MNRTLGPLSMPLTDHNRSEWARLARSAYDRHRSDIGHRFSVAASRRAVSVADYDDLQSIYRNWLCFNELPEVRTGSEHEPACDVLYSAAERAEFAGQLILIAAIAHLRGLSYDDVAIPFDARAL